MRETASDSALYHGLLDGLVEEREPEYGQGTETLRDRLAGREAVPVVDHLNEPNSLTAADIDGLLAPLGDGIRWVDVGRDRLADLAWDPPVTIDVPAYRPQVLVDVVTARADDALGGRPLDHAVARRSQSGPKTTRSRPCSSPPTPARTASSRRMSRPASRRSRATQCRWRGCSRSPRTTSRGLRELIALDAEQRGSVAAATAAIAATPG